MKRFTVICLLFLSSVVAQLAQAAPVAISRHNLSVGGPGPVRASVEQQICIFCHTPHTAKPIAPGWNRRKKGHTYTPYSSSTAIALPGQPTGTSVLCLGCHDGTVALGEVLSRLTPIRMVGGISVLPRGSDVLDTDLSDDHPISFEYTSFLAGQNEELVNPATLTGPVKLDATGQLQCTTCHDPHDDTYGQFLVMSNLRSALCQTCHRKNDWLQSSHSTSPATWNRIFPNPWPYPDAWKTVAENACENCHTPHTAGGNERLLFHGAEENNCNVCHNGNVAKTDILADLNKFSSHPVVDTEDVHDPTEPTVIQSRHVECVDCHEPHAVSSTGTGSLPGSLNRVRGVDTSGIEVQTITAEYQLCFRCHADSTGKPPAPTERQIEQTNVRLEFITANPSSHPVAEHLAPFLPTHPVAGPGVNPNVPSLIAPRTEISTIACGDCHASNSSSSSEVGGSGPKGPHGSIYQSILVRQYETQDNTRESPSVYALCYTCHDRDSILADESFKGHNLHIQGDRTPCNICHDPHGISLTQGNAINNSHLINFDTTIVFPNADGKLHFEDQGTYAGACYLNCHNKEHNPLTYP